MEALHFFQYIQIFFTLLKVGKKVVESADTLSAAEVRCGLEHRCKRKPKRKLATRRRSFYQEEQAILKGEKTGHEGFPGENDTKCPASRRFIIWSVVKPFSTHLSRRSMMTRDRQ